MADEKKPSILLIGGLGFIGRYLALHIHKNNLASDFRIVDKQLPELAWLAPEFKEAISAADFKQGDMSREETAAKLFTKPDGTSYDYIFNCGGDTRYSQDDEVYKQRSLALSLTVGREAAKRNVKVFIELSTGAVYKSESGGTPCKETAKLKPWLRMAKYKLQAEEELSKLQYALATLENDGVGANGNRLPLVVLRIANVYGEYCTRTIGTMLCMAQVYKYLGREMKWLWTKDLKQNTVHVKDVARALWETAEWYVAGKKGWDAEKMGDVPVFNVVDHTGTDQGLMATYIHNIFGITTGFHGTIISQFAKLNLGSAVDEENDELLQPWSQLLEKAKITRPGPINPYLEGEVIKDSDMNLDGSRLEEIVGFKYEVPKFEEQNLRSMIKAYEGMGWWPNIPEGEEGKGGEES
ncbi:NAD(P)-binding protein [Ascobolus immersus RN42]|uniref:NAD(P)-binding protein n=1 Tax=Ascobolus immersus RN42 TaxID=1160509 RepID=A0A3N4I5I6_ASCIM|nr:NAD(P)-binding protein [Ascobolus immersus RN42]